MAQRNKKLKILIGEPKNYSPEAISTYRKLGSVLIPKSKKEFNGFLPQADVLVIRLGIRTDKKLLSKARNLKVIATNTTGLNHIDLEEAKRRGIAIISLRGHTAFLEKIHATPELTFGLILSLVRNIPRAFDGVRKGEWDRNKYGGNDLCGKTLGLLGLGRIGKLVAGYGRTFGMKVMACDPFVADAEFKSLGAKKVGMDQLFKESDVVSVHVLYTPEIDKMIGEKHFKLMKKSGFFINTARGELVDETAFLKALKEKKIAGAAIDVLRDERPDGGHLKNNLLLKYAVENNNLIITPHIGGATLEAWRATEEFLANLVTERVKVLNK
ncbi:MAG: NAD(P)-dependent oxidoreductase [bacterium]|nr:NAD(P)-dependent oxidoreductase [bacterium]